MSRNISAKKKAAPVSLRFLRFVYRNFGNIFPNYFGALAYQQWFTTARFKTPAYEKIAVGSARKETLNVNSLDIMVYIWPSENADKTKSSTDKTLLFIHGWTGRGTQIVKYIKPLNALGYRVISFDGPAHGRTEGKQSSILEFTDAVLALEKHYGSFDAAITHSFGGMVLAYAMSMGLTINRVACLCPPQSFAGLLENFQRILAFPDSVKKVITRKLYASHGQILRDAVDTLNNAKNMSNSALIIHDRDDDEIPWQRSKEIADAWKGSTFVLTEGLGHRRIIHDKAVVKQVINFLK